MELPSERNAVPIFVECGHLFTSVSSLKLPEVA